MATLEILCPNGRRERVKVQPGTPLLEVKEMKKLFKFDYSVLY